MKRVAIIGWAVLAGAGSAAADESSPQRTFRAEKLADYLATRSGDQTPPSRTGATVGVGMDSLSGLPDLMEAWDGWKLSPSGRGAALSPDVLRDLVRDADVPDFKIVRRPSGLNCPTCMPGGAPEPLAGMVYTPHMAGGAEETSTSGITPIPVFLPGTPAAETQEVRNRWDALVRRLNVKHMNAVVRVGYRDRTSVCTGVLVASNWVLTAGHCVASLPTRVFVGPLYLSADAYALAPGGCFLHANALGSSGTVPQRCGMGESPERFVPEYDLALLQLDTPVPDSRALPAELLSGASSDDLAGRFSRMVGFGTEIYEPSTPGFVAPPLTRLNGPARLRPGTGFPKTLDIVSITSAFIAAGDSGGPTFLACTDSASSPELLAAVNVHSDASTRVALATGVFDDSVGAWIRQLAPSTRFVAAKDCLSAVNTDCSHLSGSDLVNCVLNHP